MSKKQETIIDTNPNSGAEPSDIHIQEVRTEVPPLHETESHGAAAEESPANAEEKTPESKLTPEQVQLVNRLMLDSGITALGSMLAGVTDCPDLAFTKQEHDVLVEVWLPLIPALPPWTGAALATVIILTGKVVIYGKYKRAAQNPDKKGVKAGQSSDDRAPLRPTE